MENFYDIDPQLAVHNLEDIHSDPTILYEDYVNVDQNVVVCRIATDADIIAKLVENNQDKDGLVSGDEENKQCRGNPYLVCQKLWCMYMSFDALLKVV